VLCRLNKIEKRFQDALECLLAMEGLPSGKITEFRLVDKLGRNIRIYASDVFGRPKRFAVVVRAARYADFEGEDLLFPEVLLNHHFDELIYYFEGNLISRYKGELRAYIAKHADIFPKTVYVNKKGRPVLVDQPYYTVPLDKIPRSFMIFEPREVNRPKDLREVF